MYDVVTVGEALVLLAANEPGPLSSVRSVTSYTAGAETNVAVGLARLGLRVAWASRLGDDDKGRYLREAFVCEGIDCTHVNPNRLPNNHHSHAGNAAFLTTITSQSNTPTDGTVRGCINTMEP